jgi:hypothetical protein
VPHGFRLQHRRFLRAAPRETVEPLKIWFVECQERKSSIRILPPMRFDHLGPPENNCVKRLTIGRYGGVRHEIHRE